MPLDALGRTGRTPSSGYLHAGRRCLSLSAALLLSPLALGLGLPIGLANAALHGPGKIFFRQQRVGRDGRAFRIWKFRTLPGPDPDPRVAFARWSDGRSEGSAFGRWLRRTHLDELPQLWNVWKGDMDLVGPRPEMLEVDEWASSEVPGFRRRNVVRPGVTGLAQVTHGYAGRDVEAYRLKLDSDLEYLREASLTRDLGLLARTALYVLRPVPRRVADSARRPEARAEQRA